MATTAELVKILGGKNVVKVGTRVELRLKAREGLPWACCDAVTGLLALTRKETAHVLKMAPRTLARRREEGKLKADESDRLLRLARIVAHGTRALGSVDNAVEWLHRPNRALDGERPIDLLDNDLGAEEVDDALGRLEHGVFS